MMTTTANIVHIGGALSLIIVAAIIIVGQCWW